MRFLKMYFARPGAYQGKVGDYHHMCMFEHAVPALPADHHAARLNEHAMPAVSIHINKQTKFTL